MREDSRSPIWGGATLGLVVGLILGFFVGGSYWQTVLIAVGIGAGAGLVANVIAWPGHRRQVKRRQQLEHGLLARDEKSLRERTPEDFWAWAAVLKVEDEERWRTGYDSLGAFYAAHEEQHPDIRTYAARAREHLLSETEGVLRENSPADFETKPDAAFDCVRATLSVVESQYWRAGYDSLESFYAAHEERHPDIRAYAAVCDALTSEDIERGGPAIAQRIAQHPASAQRSRQ